MRLLCKLILVLFLSVAFHFTSFGQQHEIGLRLSSLENFGFVYKKQKSENRYIRHRLVRFNANLFDRGDQEGVFSAGLGYAIGLEKRRAINDKLMFVHGFEPNISVSLSSADSDTDVALGLGLGYVLGFQYNISEAFYVNLEAIPALNGGFLFNSSGANSSTIGFGLNSSAIAVTLAYRFDFKK